MKYIYWLFQNIIIMDKYLGIEHRIITYHNHKIMVSIFLACLSPTWVISSCTLLVLSSI